MLRLNWSENYRWLLPWIARLSHQWATILGLVLIFLIVLWYRTRRISWVGR